MYMIAIALLGAMLLSLSIATTEPQQIVTLTQARGDALAGNFWTYRGMLVAYQNDHLTTASGTVAPAALASYQPLGYIPLVPPDPQWSNYFDENRVLYTFSVTPATSIPAATIDAIANRHGRSVMVGIADSSGNTMTSIFTLMKNIYPQNDPSYPMYDPPVSSKVSFPLPLAAGIPAGALVVVAN